MKRVFVVSLLMMAACTPNVSLEVEKHWAKGMIENAKLREISGLAQSFKYKGAFWAINDSNNAANLFLISPDGKNLGEIRIKDVQNQDWEALGTGPCEFAKSCVFIADIGDNSHKRESLEIHILPEPEITFKSAQVIKTLRFKMPNAPHDSEAILVNPLDGTIFLIEKNRRENIKDQARILKLINKENDDNYNAELIEWAKITTTNPLNSYNGPFTDATFDEAGKEVFIRDYRLVYRFKQPISKDALIDLIPLKSPAMKQGESLAKIIGRQELLTASEGLHEDIKPFEIEEMKFKNE